MMETWSALETLFAINKECNKKKVELCMRIKKI